ncbi:unnamed protein product [Brachionus calyciflorus]|uniref:Ferric-chelate reductase 1 n=1 Tax=Brachionus calyciflorus TaxID=104777 RepID=A0A813NCY1_9BILA|nr:unnamed protein product [Brachionus calyciflorus]
MLSIRSCTLFLISFIFKINVSYQLTEDCGKGYGCFLNPPNCNYYNCTTVVKWKDMGNYVDFIVASNSTEISALQRYNGVGFSNDNYMGEDSVSLCRFSVKSFSYVVESYYNTDKSEPDVVNFTIRTLGHFNYVMTINQTYLICNFSRVKFIEKEPQYYNLHLPYHILVSFGEIDSLGSPKYHGQNSFSSIDKINFQFNNITLPYAYSNIIGNGFYENWPFKISWTSDSKQIYFEFTTKVSDSNNVWSAFGFSQDTSMGNDDVCLCKILNGKATIEHYVNLGKQAPTLLDQNQPSLGFSNMSASISDGLLKCTFSRLITYPKVANYFDLNNGHYVLTAKGVVDPYNGNILKHAVKLTSTQKINFLSKSANFTESSEDEGVKITKAKTHGCLMVIAWIFFASTGMVFGRYMKFLFPNFKLCGLRFWFLVHQPCMIMVSLISIAAFLVILSKCEWKWISTDEPINYAHSIFGIVAICFSIFQGFVGLLRPSQSHSRRYIFNYFHKIMGYSAFIFSIVALFLGVCISEMELDRAGWGIMIGWTLWCIILPVTLEILKLLFKAKQNPYRINGNDRDDSNQNSKKTNEQNASFSSRAFYQKCFHVFKTVFLFIHLFVAFGFTLALVVCIGIANENRFLG